MDKTSLATDKTSLAMRKTKKTNEEVEHLKAQLARALADYDNLRKRLGAEKDFGEKIAASRAVSKFLPVLDMLLDAQKHIQDAGLEIVIGEFRRSLNELGIEEIKAVVGEDFNPLEEEAVEMIAGEGKENTIAEVTQIGWKIKGDNFIIRPAKVKVYKITN